MEIKHTTLDDLDSVMDIYDNARTFMKERGNPDQWINGYPGVDVIKNDILNKNSYVCIESSRIVGVFTFIQGVDPTYLKIYHGSWLNNEPYGVIHRIASANSVKGVVSDCLNWCFTKCNNIRIDTHKDNLIMQNILAKNNFTLCGIIFLENGAERLAYHKNNSPLNISKID